MTRRLRDERGQSLVMAIVFMTALLGMAGFVLDVGSWYRTQRAAQSAADAAALAGAQSLPDDTTGAATVAAANGAANGGNLPDNTQHIWFSPAGDVIHVKVDRPTGSFFSQVLGVVAPTVHATAAAHTFIPGEAKYVAPIAVALNHPMLDGTAGCPCFGPGYMTSIPLGKVPTGSGSKNVPGAFMLIDLDKTGGVTGASTLGDWIRNGFDDYLPLGDYNSDTGAKFNASSIQDALSARLNSDLAFPIYDSISGTGANAEYHVVGWAVFHLTYVPPSSGNSGELDGYFQKTIWDGLEATTGGTPPDLGMRSIELVQ